MLVFFQTALFLSFSVYFFGSGGFQLCDVFIAVLSLGLLFNRGLTRSFWQVFGRDISLLAIVGLLLFSSLNLGSHALFGAENGLPSLAIEYLYYLFLFYTFLLLVYSIVVEKAISRMISTFFWWIFLSGIPPLISLVKFSITNQTLLFFRLPLSFNNPNQLAIFSMLCTLVLTLLYLFYAHFFSPKQSRYFWGLLFLQGLLLFCSTSRAGIFVVLCWAAVLIRFSQLKRIKFQSIVLVFLVLASTFWVGVGRNIDFVQLGQDITILDRFTSSNENVEDDLYVRSFHIIHQLFTDPALFYKGSGEMRTNFQSLEVHNDVLSILYQVGIVGFFLFVLGMGSLMLTLYRRTPLAAMAFGSYLCLGMFHYTFRPRIFWFFLAFTIIIARLTPPNEEITLP